MLKVTLLYHINFLALYASQNRSINSCGVEGILFFSVVALVLINNGKSRVREEKEKGIVCILFCYFYVRFIKKRIARYHVIIAVVSFLTLSYFLLAALSSFIELVDANGKLQNETFVPSLLKLHKIDPQTLLI